MREGDGAPAAPTPGGAAAAAGLPEQRPPAPEEESSAQVLRGLGHEALVQIVERSGYGVCITGDDHTWLYLNPAGARLVGRPFAELRGQDYLTSFAEHEREALAALEAAQREGDTGFYTATLVQPDGTEVEMTWSGSEVVVDGTQLAPAVFHATDGIRRAEREAAALGAAAARTAAGGTVREVLDMLVHEAVAGTRAVACLALVAPDRADLPPERRPLRVAGRAGLPVEADRAVEHAGWSLSVLPGAALLLAGRPLVRSDDREQLRAAPGGAAVSAALGDAWQSSVKVAVRRGGDVVGFLSALLPPDVTAPSEAELAFLSALAAHATVALTHEDLRERVARQSAELERQRLGRDLHDSVSQALFSLHTRSEVIARALAADDRELLSAAARDLGLLSRQALDELRQLLVELRPEGLAEPGALARALGDLAAGAAADGLRVTVEAEPLPALPTVTAGHLYRIAREALHNTVKHARAGQAVVRLVPEAGTLVLQVRDDGRGFEPGADAGSGLGRRTMQERAELCGGSLQVLSRPGGGTTVVARVPLPD